MYVNRHNILILTCSHKLLCVNDEQECRLRRRGNKAVLDFTFEHFRHLGCDTLFSIIDHCKRLPVPSFRLKCVFTTTFKRLLPLGHVSLLVASSYVCSFASVYYFII